MSERVYVLSDEEKSRLIEGLRTAYTVPLIDDVEDFVWEAIFHYVKGIPLYDPIAQGRTKQLFDVVTGGRGWSLKTLLWNHLDAGAEFEFVIQRADIFTKAADLGFPKGLTTRSDPVKLGAALVRHWNGKHHRDLTEQKVRDPRIAILLKDSARRKFVYVEFAYPPINEGDYSWQWAKEDGQGLKGMKEGEVRFKWYHSQKQLFQIFRIPREAHRFEVKWKRANLSDFVTEMRNAFAK
jgi:hypothetical protein